MKDIAIEWKTKNYIEIQNLIKHFVPKTRIKSDYKNKESKIFKLRRKQNQIKRLCFAEKEKPLKTKTSKKNNRPKQNDKEEDALAVQKCVKRISPLFSQSFSF